VKLLVGLGNPGPQYRDTRHNVGFLVIDELARRWHVESWRETFKALAAKTKHGGEPADLRRGFGGQVILAKPLTFMNLSGEAVAGIAGFYKIDPADVLIIADDAALPLGRLRARRGGSDGGHNGFKSVSQHLGTQAFPRLRIGVGRGDDRRDLADHVLGRFQPDERESVEAAVLRAADAAETFVVDGIERVMNAFNAAADNQQDPGPA
jgi:PTH1 family peptidyl-tRNA hydrolase